MRLGPMEIALILIIILIVFGVGKLPQVGNALGKGIREFRRAQQGEDDPPAKQKAAAGVAPEEKAEDDEPTK